MAPLHTGVPPQLHHPLPCLFAIDRTLGNMSSNNENLHTDEKLVVTMSEKRDPSVDHLSDPGALRDEDQRRHNIDPVREKRILRKLDLYLLPFVSLLYLLSFL
jgi:hypothetical protein